MSSWHSYPSIFPLGHKALGNLFDGPIVIEEKIDGSQISFGLIDGQLRIKSKNKELDIDNPDSMFAKAVEIIKTLNLMPEWTYRGEYLSKPKHNSLAYNRVPNNHIIIFDINTNQESYLSYVSKKEYAQAIGLECVPCLLDGFMPVFNMQEIEKYLQSTSILGGQKIEGVVIKNYEQFGPDKKALMGKYVSEAFKEVHRAEWKDKNPTSKDIISRIIDMYKTPARWNKAIQHMKEAGILTGTLKDIGVLIKEAQADIKKECEDEIKDVLYKWAIKDIERGVVGGFPEWYKRQLAEGVFNE